MSNDLISRYEVLVEELETIKTKRIRAQEALKTAEKTEKEILDELAKLGVKPENLDSEIKRLSETIEKDLTDIETEFETLKDVSSEFDDI